MGFRIRRTFDRDATPVQQQRIFAKRGDDGFIVGKLRTMTTVAVTGLLLQLPVSLGGWAFGAVVLYLWRNEPPRVQTTILNPWTGWSETIRSDQIEPEILARIEKLKVEEIVWRLRRVSPDETVTHEIESPVRWFLSPRAQQQVHDYDQRHPKSALTAKSMARRVDKVVARRDSLTPHLYHVTVMERLLDKLNRVVPETSGEVSMKVWVAAYPQCDPEDQDLQHANPHCIVIDGLEWAGIDSTS